MGMMVAERPPGIGKDGVISVAVRNCDVGPWPGTRQAMVSKLRQCGQIDIQDAVSPPQALQT